MAFEHIKILIPDEVGKNLDIQVRNAGAIRTHKTAKNKETPYLPEKRRKKRANHICQIAVMDTYTYPEYEWDSVD